MKKSLFNNDMSRRKFLGDCGKMSSIGALSSVLNMSMMNKMMAQTSGSPSDYKALVCIFLNGGNDSFNMLAPGNWGYDDYAETRQHHAIPKDDMHFIVDKSGTTNRGYRLHPNLGNVADMFNDGDVSFIANVGTLVEPMTLTQFHNRTRQRPRAISSHNDQQTQWQTSIPQSLGGSGWMGRMADILNDTANSDSYVSMGISPAGSNIMQSGSKEGPFSVKNLNVLESYDQDAHIRNIVNTQLEYNYANVLQKHHEYVRKNTIEQSKVIKELLDMTTINTVFPNSIVGQQLLTVAKCIKIQGVTGLNMTRQTFFVNQPAFDNHVDLLRKHGARMSLFNAALFAFNKALKEIGQFDNVVTFTSSDFGRSLASNRSGSDHGWGGNQLIMGGPVSGKRVFGTYPDLALGSSTDISGRGKHLPTTSVDEYYSSIAQWYGVNNYGQMETILPNIRNFHPRGAITNYAIPNLFES